MKLDAEKEVISTSIAIDVEANKTAPYAPNKVSDIIGVEASEEES
jgi:hypothetical protein